MQILVLQCILRIKKLGLHGFLSIWVFKEQNSTNFGVTGYTEDLLRQVDEGRLTIYIIIDFSKAFDTVYRIRLFSEMENINFRKVCHKLFEAHLCACIDG